MRGYKRIRVFPDRDLRATRLEIAVLDCGVMQRLRYIRQLGQSYLVFPTAEHTRLAHSLGTLYWVTKMLSYLRENYYRVDNKKILDAAEAELRKSVLRGNTPRPENIGLEIPWINQLVRLYALVHDLTHLPFGHTLEDQAGLLPRHDEDPERIKYFFKRLKEELDDSPHLRGEHHGVYLTALHRLLDQCAGVYSLSVAKEALHEKTDAKAIEAWRSIDGEVPTSFAKYLMLVHDLVSNTICADLIDYLQRDTLFSGIPWTIDKALLSHLKVLNREHVLPGNGTEKRYHIGVGVSRSGKLRHDVLTAVLSLLRARYDVTEKIYYHHTKCAADALLEKIMRESGVSVTWNELAEQDIGDEGLLRLLEDKAGDNERIQKLVKKLRARRLFKPVYRIRRASDFSPETRQKITDCMRPEERTKLEATLADDSGLQPHQIIVSCFPEKMQLKAAKALVEWVDGEILTVGELPEKRDYLREVTSLTSRYYHLWSLTVYVDEDIVEHYASVVARNCRRAFERENDSLTSRYIRHRFTEGAQVRDLVSGITDTSETRSLRSLNAASQGGAAGKDRDPKEVVLGELSDEIAKHRAEPPKKRSGLVRNKKKRSDGQVTLVGTPGEHSEDAGSEN